jgi:hypothetical protein
MSKFINKYVFFSLLILVIACNDIIDLPVPRGYEAIKVIQGVIAKTKSNVTAKVFVSNSSSGNAFSTLVRVTSVVIENSKGQMIKLTESPDGSYGATIPLNSSTFDTKSDIKYKLKVIDFQKNNYESTFEGIIDGSTLSNPQFKVEERTISNELGGVDKVKFFNSTVDIDKQPNSGTLFKFDYELSYAITEGKIGLPRGRTCYVTNIIEAKGVTLNETKLLTPDKLKKYPAFEVELDSRFAEQAYVNVIIGTISEGAREYFEQLNLLRSREVSIFQPQGDRLTSNLTTVSNQEVPVIGYFYGTYQDTARMKVDASQVGNPAHICPTTVNEVGACNFPDCCDCAKIKGSSLTKPAFWK